MKRKIIQLMLCASIYISAEAQTPANCPADPNAPISEYCEDGHGISTDPDNLINEDCPNLKNDFEWQVKHALGGSVPDESYTVYDGDGIKRLIRNPFNDPGNSEYRHLADNQLSNYHPEDGWELLKVDFGTLSNIGINYNVDPGQNTTVDGPKLPYMILYNKYTGTFRFFGGLLGQNNDYETIKIELRIPSSSSPDPNNPGNNTYQSDLKATNLLSIQGETVQPLDEETKETSLVVFAEATNNTNKFFWFDIPTAYDPCLCNIRSQLDITFSFVQTAEININGVPGSGIKSATKATTQDPNFVYAQKVIGRVFSAVLSTVVAIKTGGTVVNFKAYTDLVKLIKENPNANLSQGQKDQLTLLENFLDCGTKFADVYRKNYKDVSSSDDKKKYAAAEKLLDGSTTFISSLTTGCAGSDKAGTTVSGAFVAKGTYSQMNTIQGTEILLAMPGSNWTDKQMQINDYVELGKTIPAYPTYNERLGTFALLETPEIKVSYRELDSRTFQYISQVPGVIHQFVDERDKVYRIDPEGTLKYVFNPLLNVDMEETQIQFRYVTKQKLDLQNSGLSLHGVPFSSRNVVQNSGSMYATSTPFLPIEYYESFGPIILPLKESNFVQSYVNGQPVYLTEEQPFFNYTDSLFIQFKILMASEDNGREGKNQAYYMYTYPVKVTEENDVQDPEPLPLPEPLTTQALQNWNFQNQLRLVMTASVLTSSEPGLSGGNKSFSQDVVFSEDDVLFYDGLVDINAKLSTSGGKKVTIYSTMGFELLSGAEIGSNIELIIGYPFVSNPLLAQTHAAVSTFCSNTNKYKAQTFSSAALKEEKEEYEHRTDLAREAIEKRNSQNLELKLYPNPTNNEFSIELDYALANLAISVTDVNGKQVYYQYFSGEKSKITLDASILEAGVYFIDVHNPNGKVGRERLVKY